MPTAGGSTRPRNTCFRSRSSARLFRGKFLDGLARLFDARQARVSPRARPARRQSARARGLRPAQGRALREELGRLRQGPFQEARRALPLPRPVHPPGRHLQPPHPPRRRRPASSFAPATRSVCRARASGIHAPLSPARPASRLRQDPTLRPATPPATSTPSSPPRARPSNRKATSATRRRSQRRPRPSARRSTGETSSTSSPASTSAPVPTADAPWLPRPCLTRRTVAVHHHRAHREPSRTSTSSFFQPERYIAVSTGYLCARRSIAPAPRPPSGLAAGLSIDSPPFGRYRGQLPTSLTTSIPARSGSSLPMRGRPYSPLEPAASFNTSFEPSAPRPSPDRRPAIPAAGSNAYWFDGGNASLIRNLCVLWAVTDG